MALRDRGQQDEPVAVPVPFRAGGEEAVLGRGQGLVPGRRDLPAGAASDTVRQQKPGVGRAGQRLPGRLLLEADQAERVHDGAGPGGAVLVEGVVAQQDQQVGAGAGTAGRPGRAETRTSVIEVFEVSRHPALHHFVIVPPHKYSS